MNSATQAGLEAVNKSRQSAVEAEAQSLINLILSNQKCIAGYEQAIKLEQAELAKLADDTITQSGVMGVEFTGTLNSNQVTIANAIKKLNDSRQESVSLKSQKHINAVTRTQDTIKELDKQIAEWRDKLAKLAAEVVTAEQVVTQ